MPPLCEVSVLVRKTKVTSVAPGATSMKVWVGVRSWAAPMRVTGGASGSRLAMPLGISETASQRPRSSQMPEAQSASVSHWAAQPSAKQKRPGAQSASMLQAVVLSYWSTQRVSPSGAAGVKGAGATVSSAQPATSRGTQMSQRRIEDLNYKQHSDDFSPCKIIYALSRTLAYKRKCNSRKLHTTVYQSFGGRTHGSPSRDRQWSALRVPPYPPSQSQGCTLG